MTKQKKLVYTLTTSYLNALKSKKHFVFFEDQALIDGGFEVHTITQHLLGLPKFEEIDSIKIFRYQYLPEKYEISGSLPDALKSSFIGKIKLLFLSTRFFTTTFFKCLKKKPDVILAHWAIPAGIIAFFMLKFFGVKYLVSIHGGEVAPLKHYKILRNFVIKILNNSSCVIVNGGFTQKIFENMGVEKNKLKIIHGPPNYVSHSNDFKLLNKFRSKFVSPDTKIILCVARLTEFKGIEYLIHALTLIKSKNTHCIIVGYGELLNPLKELTKKLKVYDQITFYGRAEHPELGFLYDVSDLFVLPSIIDSTGATDAMPLVIPEAMESKLPVIGTNVGGIPFMIKHEVNGLLVEQKNPNELASAIDRILTDRNLTNKLITNSQQLVSERSLKNTHDKYIQAVSEVLNQT